MKIAEAGALKVGSRAMRVVVLFAFAAASLAACDGSQKSGQNADEADLAALAGPATPTKEGDWFPIGPVQGSVLHAYALHNMGGDQTTLVPPGGAEFIDVIYGLRTPPGAKAADLTDPPTPVLMDPDGNPYLPDERFTQAMYDSYRDPPPSLHSEIVIDPGKVTRTSAVFVVDEDHYDPRTWKVLLGPFGPAISPQVNDPPPSPFSPEEAVGAATTEQVTADRLARAGPTAPSRDR
jgi:hypothetical protein